MHSALYRLMFFYQQIPPRWGEFEAGFKDQDFYFLITHPKNQDLLLCVGFYSAPKGGDSNDLRNR
jgi:hypothetical protein